MRLMILALMTALLIMAGGAAAMAAGSAAKGKQVYMANCIACHNVNPSKPGARGPELKGSSKALVSSNWGKAARKLDCASSNKSSISTILWRAPNNLGVVAGLLRLHQTSSGGSRCR